MLDLVVDGKNGFQTFCGFFFPVQIISFVSLDILSVPHLEPQQ